MIAVSTRSVFIAAPSRRGPAAHPDSRDDQDGPLRANHPTWPGARMGISVQTRLDQTILVGVCGRCGPGGDPELREDVADVASDGFLAQHQIRRDRAVGLASRDEPDDLEF